MANPAQKRTTVDHEPAPTELAALREKMSSFGERLATLEAQHGALTLSMPKPEHILTAEEVRQRITADGSARFRVRNPEGYHAHGVRLSSGAIIEGRQYRRAPEFVAAGLQLVAEGPA